MGNVETSVTGVVSMLLGLTVTAHVITKEIARISHFTVTTHAQPVAFGMIHHTISGIHLCIRCQHHADKCYKTH